PAGPPSPAARPSPPPGAGGGLPPRRYLLAGLICCATCGRRLESAWSNGRPAYRCRHGYTSATQPDPTRAKNTYVREDQITPHLAALAVLLDGQEHIHTHHDHQPGQVTAPARAAELIDDLRSTGRTLTYDPRCRTLRTDTEHAIAVTIGRSRCQPVNTSKGESSHCQDRSTRADRGQAEVTFQAACKRPLMGKLRVREGAHPKTNAYSPVNSQLGAGHERGRGPVDPVDDDRHEDRRLSGNLQFRGSLAPTGPAVAEYQGAGSSRGSV